MRHQVAEVSAYGRMQPDTLGVLESRADDGLPDYLVCVLITDTVKEQLASPLMSSWGGLCAIS